MDSITGSALTLGIAAGERRDTSESLSENVELIVMVLRVYLLSKITLIILLFSKLISISKNVIFLEMQVIIVNFYEMFIINLSSFKEYFRITFYIVYNTTKSMYNFIKRLKMIYQEIKYILIYLICLA